MSWKIHRHEAGIEILNERGYHIADLPWHDDPEETEREAALIVAVPIMLAALQQIETLTVQGGTIHTLASGAINAAGGAA